MSIKNAEELNRVLSEATEGFVAEIGKRYDDYSKNPACEADIKELATQTLSVLSVFRKAIVEYAKELEKK